MKLTYNQFSSLFDGVWGVREVFKALEAVGLGDEYDRTTETLYEYNLIGSDIWMLYKDVCGYNTLTFIKFVKEIQDKERDGARIKHILRNEYDFHVPSLIDKDYMDKLKEEKKI